MKHPLEGGCSRCKDLPGEHLAVSQALYLRVKQAQRLTAQISVGQEGSLAPLPCPAPAAADLEKREKGLRAWQLPEKPFPILVLA